MPTPSTIYAVGAEHTSFHVFSDTRFYLFSYELDFLVNKDVLLQAQYYAVGDPKEGNDNRKLVDLRAIGKLFRVGYFDIVWKKRKDPVISNIRYDKGSVGKKEQDDFMIRLENATRKLYDARHKPEDKDVQKTIAFVEVEKVFPILTPPVAYYFRKTLLPLELEFSPSGASLPTVKAKGCLNDAIQEPKISLYRITQHLAFDMTKKKLLQLGRPNKPVTFSGLNAKLKISIFDHLACAEDGLLEVEDLINLAGIRRVSGRSEREVFNDIIAEIRKRLLAFVPEEEKSHVFTIEKGLIRLGKYMEAE